MRSFESFQRKNRITSNAMNSTGSFLRASNTSTLLSSNPLETVSPGEHANSENVGYPRHAEYFFEHIPLFAPEKKNNTGLPDALKAGIESLSGIAMDDVHVHYSSSKPAHAQALAYTQGTSIHLAQGQEHHLPHEAWHVIQQKQGRVQPTSQTNEIMLNDEPALEREADQMGTKVIQEKQVSQQAIPHTPSVSLSLGREPIQRVYANQQYNSNGRNRLLSVDPQTVTWGNALPANRPAQNNQRAIMFETISTPGRIGNLMQAYRQRAVGALWDVGLSVVLNSFFVPSQNNVDNPQGNNLNQTHNVPPNDQLANVQNTLNAARTHIVNNWQGPPLAISTAAWERRYIRQDQHTIGLEPAKPNVPYARLRMLAATNPSGVQIRQALETRQNATTWRKMGDDDMPIPNPNDAHDRQMQQLQGIEADTEGLTTFATFGYNLTTAGATPLIQQMLKQVYADEMGLRDELSQLGVATYPIEPNTFYKFSGQQTSTTAWTGMEAQNVGGGGGQIKEGLKLLSSAQATEGRNVVFQHTFHNVQIDTDAGGRNQALIQLLQPQATDASNGILPTLTSIQVEAVLQNMDQSYFRPNEWSTIAVPLMDAQTLHNLQAQGDALVAERRKAAAEHIVFLVFHAYSMAKKWAKVAVH